MVSGARLQREGETTRPDREKVFSAGTDVAGTERISFAILDRIGNVVIFSFHHFRIPSVPGPQSTSLTGSERYLRTSS